MSNYIPIFYVNVIIYPTVNPNAGVVLLIIRAQGTYPAKIYSPELNITILDAERDKVSVSIIRLGTEEQNTVPVQSLEFQFHRKFTIGMMNLAEL